MLINLGKLLTLLAWLLMFYNIVQPFGGNISLVLNILLGVTVMMHLLQTLMFYSVFNTLMPLKAKDYLQAFVFGVFALWQYRQRALADMAKH
ncbi:DUF1145 domain-containing protein [Shewanella sp. A3A]|uniref:DUF1145 domain-containing protein n=1 Tax=Shewanella electrica TaxID=515560 RepID=A0ABT2FP05_9GAMM|nr:DUF1145 domain-containing protein [Shewanella electrica]MCH1919581.1 DUF1145 domain-containing protein [Shewanella ferrihydritica]MCH1925760.1 DUF1145 domain-containing protein [Shewanella electrica]MCS4557355.1 DUF1145 domain-containing protein [Shewanella electrica]